MREHPEWNGLRGALSPPTSVGIYEIQSILGHGGFGIVYRARHLELGSIVALKEFLPIEIALRDGDTIRPRSEDCADAFTEAQDRFLEEAKQLIRFRRHPGVVTCLDFFRANGTAYLVMEYEEGMPLSEVLYRREAEGNPFDEGDLLTLAVPLLEGLSRVHDAGVLHRDVKPSNILVRSEDGSPVLIDFGAAKQTVALLTKSFAPTTEGYAAIEQVGEGTLGTWTDLYGVGAVLWRVVAGGKPPWKPPNPTKVESRLSARVRGAPDPMPRAREIGAGRFSNRVLNAIDRCLELREEDRVQDCGQLLRLLKSRALDARGHAAQTRNDEPKSQSAPDQFAADHARPRRAVLASLVALMIIWGAGIFGFDRIRSFWKESREIREATPEQSTLPRSTPMVASEALPRSSDSDAAGLGEHVGHRNGQYRITQNDTLGTIARRFGISIEDLMSWNSLSSTRIRPGQLLIVRQERNRGETADSMPTAVPKGLYTVRRGDTLSGIAGRFGVTVATLRVWNGISGSRIFVGQRLVVAEERADPPHREQRDARDYNSTSYRSESDRNALFRLID